MKICIIKNCEKEQILEGYCFQHFKTVRGFDAFKRKIKNTGKEKKGIWLGMLRRCNDPKNINYKYYGGRGIKVCKAWHKYENFCKDMGDRPKGYQIDRIDNDGNYEPNNCRWVTARDNVRNSRTTILYPKIIIDIRKMRGNGIKVRDIHRITGIAYKTVSYIVAKTAWKEL